jgi:hypothetical protein
MSFILIFRYLDGTQADSELYKGQYYSLLKLVVVLSPVSYQTIINNVIGCYDSANVVSLRTITIVDSISTLPHFIV